MDKDEMVKFYEEEFGEKPSFIEDWGFLDYGSKTSRYSCKRLW
jgi:hypothetical protein